MTTTSTQQPAETTDFIAQRNLQLYKESEVTEPVGALPASLVEAFAEATGWELARVGDEIKIVDMSANWPAKTPTASREKCDQFAAALSEFSMK